MLEEKKIQELLEKLDKYELNALERIVLASHAPRPEGRGLPQASLCVIRRRGKCKKKRNPRSS